MLTRARRSIAISSLSAFAGIAIVAPVAARQRCGFINSHGQADGEGSAQL